MLCLAFERIRGLCNRYEYDKLCSTTVVVHEDLASLCCQ
jgi:hypothetical protein